MAAQTLRFAAPYTRSKGKTVSCTPGGTSDTDFRKGAVAAPRITTQMTGIALVGYLGISTVTLYLVNRSLCLQSASRGVYAYALPFVCMFLRIASLALSAGFHS